MVTEDCFETMSCEQYVKKTRGPAMYMYRGNNISGRGTKKCETLEVATDLVRKKTSVAGVQKWHQLVE